MPLPDPKPITLQSRIPNDAAGKELLTFLCQRFRYHSRERWQQELDEGRIALDDQRAKGSEMLQRGMRLSYEKDHREPRVATDFRVLHQDDALLTVAKPAHLPMHADGPFIRNTLISLLREAHGDELHLVHRLDRETSGICVVARTKDALKAIHEQFQGGLVRKVYVALVHGHLTEPAICDRPIGHKANATVQIRRSVAADAHQPKSACTRFEPIAHGGTSAPKTLVRCMPETGRTHQIRVHLEHLGHAIVGDKLYGHPDEHYLEFVARMKAGASVFEDTAEAPNRQLLHAHQIYLRHPVSGMDECYEAPIPEEFDRWRLS